jgi:lipopolysaccharide/colanic/teichoic acid biosynthesis glycosyltransferase
MSVQGTNSPRPKAVFGQRPPSDKVFDTLPIWVGDKTTRPSGLGQAAAQTDVAEVHSESGVSSYWIGKRPAPVTASASRSFQLHAKRLLDIVVSSIILLFLLPLLLVVGAAIKISDPGPALFKQSRLGRNGRSFTIYKFRSMYLAQCSDDGVAQTVAQDPRIMPLGNFIRRTSIDELPQLLNVLLGDMSLVGPRPHVEGQLAAGERYSDVVPYYDYRLAMRPGLTGWAQANGFRGPTDNLLPARQRVDHDVAYIQSFSLALDLRIMLLTLRREFIGGTGF